MTKSNKKICSSCNNEYALANYYATSDIEIFPDGKIPICKNCCNKIIEEKQYDGFISILRIMNKPILKKYFNNDYIDYFRLLNSLPQFKKMTFLDSDTFAHLFDEDKLALDGLKELDEESYLMCIEMFGDGYTEKDYIYLLNEYNDYLSRYEVDSKTLEILIVEICIIQLQIRKERSANKDVTKLLKAIQDLMTSASLKPVQETGANSVDQESFGTLIKKWENEHPIPKPNPEWADVDGIGKYIRTFFLGHLARLFGKENPHEKEYWDEIEDYTVRPPKEDD